MKLPTLELMMGGILIGIATTATSFNWNAHRQPRMSLLVFHNPVGWGAQQKQHHRQETMLSHHLNQQFDDETAATPIAIATIATTESETNDGIRNTWAADVTSALMRTVTCTALWLLLLTSTSTALPFVQSTAAAALDTTTTTTTTNGVAGGITRVEINIETSRLLQSINQNGGNLRRAMVDILDDTPTTTNTPQQELSNNLKTPPKITLDPPGNQRAALAQVLARSSQDSLLNPWRFFLAEQAPQQPSKVVASFWERTYAVPIPFLANDKDEPFVIELTTPEIAAAAAVAAVLSYPVSFAVYQYDNWQEEQRAQAKRAAMQKKKQEAAKKKKNSNGKDNATAAESIQKESTVSQKAVKEPTLPPPTSVTPQPSVEKEPVTTMSLSGDSLESSSLQEAKANGDATAAAELVTPLFDATAKAVAPPVSRSVSTLPLPTPSVPAPPATTGSSGQSSTGGGDFMDAYARAYAASCSSSSVESTMKVSVETTATLLETKEPIDSSSTRTDASIFPATAPSLSTLAQVSPPAFQSTSSPTLSNNSNSNADKPDFMDAYAQAYAAACSASSAGTTMKIAATILDTKKPVDSSSTRTDTSLFPTTEPSTLAQVSPPPFQSTASPTISNNSNSNADKPAFMDAYAQAYAEAVSTSSSEHDEASALP